MTQVIDTLGKAARHGMIVRVERASCGKRKFFRAIIWLQSWGWPSGTPAPTDAIASAFEGKSTAKRKDRVGQVLETLVATGIARTGEMDGQRRYFLPRQVASLQVA